MQSPIIIRQATIKDKDGIWDIFHPIVAEGEIYPFDPKTTKEEMEGLWLSEEKRTYIAIIDGVIVGTYYLRDTQPSLGAHIANAGYMVHPKYQGRGIGKALGEHSQAEAKRLGYTAMQFNFVISTNKAAISLWEKQGFKIIGTIPKGFNHQKLGFVDTHIMHKSLN